MAKDSKEEIEIKYNHKELPRVKNFLWYGYSAFMKLFFYVFFGLEEVIG